ncbi:MULTISPECIES: zinc-dependent alcohol dehydrogenase family protein [unclassified Methylophaga]|uniref:zinc-dependent alcohol dehydrogenase family protein n=1 Tax=unclassified Methylophaga TaxID=2629249 RepID=UPI000C8A0E2F|nr:MULTISPECIES: zinc-dependent alcohol dehydrogenase family protein [unclassified Methylophaga]MBN45178.1 NADPH:quinone oxidoreductase [Methylophaga sp.]|tara:strand:- start:112523 stop:113494 length:972 start_codon:yes stop_codon:yes gene_type:complete
MKAVILKSFGGPESFELQDVAVPEVGIGELLVRVMATAINPLDFQIRRGDYPEYVPLPAITGHDVSGVVEKVGPGVTDFKVGDEVFYTPQIFGPKGGSYAEYNVVPESLVTHKPANLSHEEAASTTLVGGTAWEALVSRAKLNPAESILIHGGAGGVGSIAIQLAKTMGAIVYTTCRGSDQEFVRELGADHAIDYTSKNYIEEIASLTGNKGVNVVFDTIGGQTLSQSPNVLSDAGRVVSIVDLATPQNLIAAWGVNAEYHFVFTRQNRGKLQALKTLLESGQIRPIIGAKFSLAQIPEAHTALERGEVNGKRLQGKVVISVS